MTYAAELEAQLKKDEPQLRHVVSTTDISTPMLTELLDNADVLEAAHATREGRAAKRQLLSGRSVLTFFGEDSSRTRISSETAARRLGADVSSITEKIFSSFAKG